MNWFSSKYISIEIKCLNGDLIFQEKLKIGAVDNNSLILTAFLNYYGSAVKIKTNGILIDYISGKKKIKQDNVYVFMASKSNQNLISLELINTE